MKMEEWLTLDRVISEQTELMLQAKDSSEYSVARIMRDYLSELKVRIESDLRPADKFLGNCTAQQLKHMDSEIEEIYKEFNSKKIEEFSLERFCEEIVDLQMSCETLLAIMGLDEQQRREARKKVIEKNQIRGYYRKGEE